MVALVRGVHGLRGAVRVEVLTDRPEERFIPGAILHREGSAEPLTIASAEAIPDGPGWRLRFDKVPDRSVADSLREAYLEAATDASDALPVGAGTSWKVRTLPGAGLLERERSAMPTAVLGAGIVVSMLLMT
ncbi:MAG: hypothetical protein M3P84_02545, partial [Chloroflexota bacterium]|nr:hypothetical protein [Chloroflexota bacterium]